MLTLVEGSRLGQVGWQGLQQPQGTPLRGPQGVARPAAATFMVTDIANDQWASQLCLIRTGLVMEMIHAKKGIPRRQVQNQRLLRRRVGR